MRRLPLLLLVFLVAGILVSACGHGSSRLGQSHTVNTTYFWVGEPPTPDNHFIPNSPSVWQDDWVSHYGGFDDPKARNGYLPAAFRPKENPFYFALPYSDYSADGKQKSDARRAPWFYPAPPGISIIKNRWIAVKYHGRTVYGQWEDAGPLGEDDVDYVFGSAAPHFKTSGLDLSPAMAHYVGLNGEGRTTWRFVDESEVPAGPWKEIITTSQIDWR